MYAKASSTVSTRRPGFSTETLTSPEPGGVSALIVVAFTQQRIVPTATPASTSTMP